jgi:hypothetical protein
MKHLNWRISSCTASHSIGKLHNLLQWNVVLTNAGVTIYSVKLFFLLLLIPHPIVIWLTYGSMERNKDGWMTWSIGERFDSTEVEKARLHWSIWVRTTPCFDAINRRVFRFSWSRKRLLSFDSIVAARLNRLCKHPHSQPFQLPFGVFVYLAGNYRNG